MGGMHLQVLEIRGEKKTKMGITSLADIAIRNAFSVLVADDMKRVYNETGTAEDVNFAYARIADAFHHAAKTVLLETEIR